MKYAVCEFYKDGTIFPVSYDLDEAEAASRLAWMKTGAGQFEDWRIVSHADLDLSKINYGGYTERARIEHAQALADLGAKWGR